MMLLLAIIYIAMILAVILLERKNPTEALLWVIILICLPGLGMILYLIFGDTMAIKITAYVRKKRLRKYESRIKSARIDEQQLEHLSDEDNQVMQFNSMYNHSQLTCYDSIDIYTWGKDHYEKLFDDIKLLKSVFILNFILFIMMLWGML